MHRNLGVACTALGATQFTAIVFRPAPGQKYRLAWQLWHAWVGRGVSAFLQRRHARLKLGSCLPWVWAHRTP